ncbi:MAG: N-acetylneuraminate synthase [Lachnospiraceae bacterium]|nr:N-acetylneuraminate synthase [Lachnospiraceae bacterium]
MNKRTLIIAEAGVNHNGDIDIAKRLIEVAKMSGADIVKFQTAKLSSVVSKNAKMAKYQKENIGQDKSQKEMLSKLLLPFSDFYILADYCKSLGIEFLSTPFDIESIHFLNELQNLWKIPSGEITNYPYLVEIAKTGKAIIMSTGMSTMQEVEDALQILENNGAGEITLLHCTTSYPTKMQDVNLRAMLALKDRFKCNVGYSDHTKGVEVPIAAVAMGATVIEKHFTLDSNMTGPDHKASLNPDELKGLVSSIRNIELALGNGNKIPTEIEKANIMVARKSIIAACDIKKGEVLTESNITTKRPGDGINPMKWHDVIGTKAIRNFSEDDLIEV